MKSGLISIILLLCLCFVSSVLADASLFHIDLNRPCPKPGDEGERAIAMFSSMSTTNSTPNGQTVSNSFRFLEVKGREKILSWDPSNDTSKVEMLVESCIQGDNLRTNNLLNGGDRLVGTSLLGEPFFRSDNRALSSEVHRQLLQAYGIRPRNYNEFAQTKVPPSISVGDVWKLDAPKDLATMASLGLPLTNDVKATGQLVGITNFAGLDCVHLQFRVTSNEKPAFIREQVEGRLPVKMTTRVTLLVDLIVPIEEWQPILSKSYFMDFESWGEMVLDAKQTNTSQGRVTTRMVSELRPLSRP
jgi:hypothetical protein